jgi:hypothetical protein
MLLRLNLIIVTAALSLVPIVGAAQGLKNATVAFTAGNWKVLRSIDQMKDTVNCTGIYKDNYQTQLTRDTLYIGVQGGLESVTLRFRDKPARSFRLAEKMEKEIRSIIISGSDFSELLESDRLRFQASTLVSGIKTDDLDLTGIREAQESIRSGCPIDPAAAAVGRTAPSSSSLCSAILASRMKAQGLRDEQIAAICRQ